MAEAEMPYPWNEFPSVSASDQEWARFKSQAYDELIVRIRQADRELGRMPQARAERVRGLRREHHLIVIADRIRRSRLSPAGLSGADLRKAAEFVLDRTASAANKDESTPRRSSLEERMVLSARVNWHKVMRRAGSRAELRGALGAGRPELQGITTIFKKISAPRLAPEARAALLRDHIEERVEQLLQLAQQVSMQTDRKLPRNDRLLVRDLENLLARVRCSKPPANEGERPAKGQRQRPSPIESGSADRPSGRTGGRGRDRLRSSAPPRNSGRAPRGRGS